MALYSSLRVSGLLNRSEKTLFLYLVFTSIFIYMIAALRLFFKREGNLRPQAGSVEVQVRRVSFYYPSRFLINLRRQKEHESPR